MQVSLKAAGVTLLALVLYLLLWPVPLSPVAWQAPMDRGYVEPFLPNDQLRFTTTLDLNEHEGPEDATIGGDGNLYVTTKSGSLIRIRNRQLQTLATLSGRGLGIETDHDGNLIVANAYAGLQHITLDGIVTTLLDEIDGEPLENANSLAIGPAGTIYFSVSSHKFTAADYGGTYEASIAAIVEHGGHGAVYSFDPVSGQLTTLLSGLNYANGVAISSDAHFLLVAETGHYRILKFWLQGPRRGETDIVLENLPGFPDNIKNGLHERFWVGFAAPRNRLIDKLAGKPWLRKIVWRLPGQLRPKAEPISHVIAINGEGEVLMNLHDQRKRFPALTGVVETADALVLTTLFGAQLPILLKRDL